MLSTSPASRTFPIRAEALRRKCVYDNQTQQDLVKSVLSGIEHVVERLGENMDRSQRDPSQSFHDAFVEVENDLLRIAALMKHGGFEEEREWRVVSTPISNYVQAPIRYREGRSMLIPFLEFSLRNEVSGQIPIEHIWLGPTPNPKNSMASLSQFLSKHGVNPDMGVEYCQIPYRER